MITELRLINWKSFRDTRLYINPLSVLIGLNASGKSNLIDALRFLQRSTSTSFTEAITGNAQVPEIRGGVEMSALIGERSFGMELVIQEEPNKTLHYSLEVVLTDHGQIPKVYLFSEKLLRRTVIGKYKKRVSEKQLLWTDPPEEQSEFIVARIKNKRGTPHQLHRQSSALSHLNSVEVVAEVKHALDTVRSTLQRIFLLDPIPSHTRSFSRLSDSLNPDGGNVAGVIAGLNEDEQKRVEDALTKYVGKLPDNPFSRIYTELVGKFEQDAMLYGEEVLPRNKKIDIDARSMSDGTLRIIAIMTAILTRPKGSLIVVEEVDNGIHPSKAKLLLQYLDELSLDREIDILVTTHNAAMMDALSQPGDMIPFVSVIYRDDEDGVSQIKSLDDLEELPRLLSYGSLGKVATQGLVDQFVARGS